MLIHPQSTVDDASENVGKVALSIHDFLFLNLELPLNQICHYDRPPLLLESTEELSKAYSSTCAHNDAVNPIEENHPWTGVDLETSHDILNILGPKDIHILVDDISEWRHSSESDASAAVEYLDTFRWIVLGELLAQSQS